MPQNWKTYKLGEIAKIKYGKDHKKLDEGSIPCIGTGGVMRYVDSFLSEKESVLIPRKGSLNNIYYINEPFWTVDTLFWTQVDQEFVIAKYLYYYLKTIDFASKDVGSAVPSLTTELLNNLDLIFPPLPEQRAIASILSSLDDKIELNLQMNKTLEEMAMTLYKHWFVDFGPFKDGKFVDSELGPIPEGWEVKRIGDIAAVIDCLHSKKPELIFEPNGNIFIQLANILDNGLLDLSKTVYVNDKDYEKWTSRIEVNEGDCIITNVGRSGAVARIPKNVQAAIGRNITAIRLKNDFNYPGFFITMLASDSMAKTIIRFLDEGTILKALNVKNIPNLYFFFPNDNSIIEKLEPTFENLRTMMEENVQENRALTALRDTLLPKLISGDVRVKDAQQTIAEAL